MHFTILRIEDTLLINYFADVTGQQPCCSSSVVPCQSYTIPWWDSSATPLTSCNSRTFRTASSSLRCSSALKLLSRGIRLTVSFQMCRYSCDVLILYIFTGFKRIRIRNSFIIFYFSGSILFFYLWFLITKMILISIYHKNQIVLKIWLL